MAMAERCYAICFQLTCNYELSNASIQRLSLAYLASQAPACCQVAEITKAILLLLALALQKLTFPSRLSNIRQPIASGVDHPAC